MFSDAASDNNILDPATQEEMPSPPPAAASGPVSARASFGPARSASVTSTSATTVPNVSKPSMIVLISKAELGRIRRHNRILRSNNISIFEQRNEMEARAVAAERVLALEQGRSARYEEAIRLMDDTVARVQREKQMLVERLRAVEGLGASRERRVKSEVR